MGLSTEDIWILELSILEIWNLEIWKFALINGNFLANGESMSFWGLILLIYFFVIVYREIV
jgi:hypothetical protein